MLVKTGRKYTIPTHCDECQFRAYSKHDKHGRATTYSEACTLYDHPLPVNGRLPECDWGVVVEW